MREVSFYSEVYSRPVFKGKYDWVMSYPLFSVKQTGETPRSAYVDTFSNCYDHQRVKFIGGKPILEIEHSAYFFYFQDRVGKTLPYYKLVGGMDYIWAGDFDILHVGGNLSGYISDPREEKLHLVTSVPGNDTVPGKHGERTTFYIDVELA